MSKQRFGPPNGPYLDIYNYSDIKSTPITLEDAATAIYSSNNSNWGKVAQVLPAHLAKSVKEGRCKTIVGHVEGHMLIALNYKRGTEAGNALRLIEKHGPYEINGDPDILEPLDNLLEAFVKQHRMKLPGTAYVPCYKITQ